MNKDEIREWVEANPNLVTVKRSIRYPDLRVLKYHRKVFYDNLWGQNDLLLDLRGTVVDEDFNPVIMPFRKIFNQYENDTNIPRDEQVIAVQKVNGFMGAVTTYRGEIYFSTTGSLDSDYVQYIKDMLPDTWKSVKHNHHVTWLFEIVHPDDPHVIPEKVGAYLIGSRIPKWGEDDNGYGGNVLFQQERLDQTAEELGVMWPNWKLIRFSDLCKEVKECEHEGYVAYGNQTTLKLKSPYYKITKLFGRMKDTKLNKYFRDLKHLKQLKQTLDEEYYPLLDHLIEHQELFLAMTEQTKMKFIREFLS